jgi:hypothetical protein
VKLFFLENVIVNAATNLDYLTQRYGQNIMSMHSYEVELYIDKYILKQNYQSRLPGYYFDDLGAERQIKCFGNECNVIAEIILSIYDIYTVKTSKPTSPLTYPLPK